MTIAKNDMWKASRTCKPGVLRLVRARQASPRSCRADQSAERATCIRTSVLTRSRWVSGGYSPMAAGTIALRISCQSKATLMTSKLSLFYKCLPAISQLQMHMQISRKNSAFECFGKSRSAKLLDASIEGSLVGRPGEPMTVLGPVLQQPLECTLDPHHVWGLVFKT